MFEKKPTVEIPSSLNYVYVYGLIGERDTLNSGQSRTAIVYIVRMSFCPLTLRDSYKPVKMVERKFEIATKTLCLRVSYDLF